MKNDSDLKRNASGYIDEPCYKACTALPKPGEIWADSNGHKHWLVMRSRDTVCSTLLLDTKEKENSIMVMGRMPMYTDPIMIGYTFTDKMTQFVKTVKAEEFTKVQREVGRALGVIDLNLVATVPHDHINALEAKNAELHDTVIKLLEKNKCLNDTVDLATEDIGNLTDNIDDLKKEIAKLNIYKDMYTELIDKLVCARGGAVND